MPAVSPLLCGRAAATAIARGLLAIASGRCDDQLQRLLYRARSIHSELQCVPAVSPLLRFRQPQSRAQHAAQPRTWEYGQPASIIATAVKHSQSRAQHAAQPRAGEYGQPASIIATAVKHSHSRAQHAAQPRPDAAQSRAWEYGRLFSDRHEPGRLRLLL